LADFARKLTAFAVVRGLSARYVPTMKLDKATLIVALPIAAVIALQKYDLSRFGWGDAFMFGLLGLLLWWCFSSRGGEATGHEQPHQGVAFRLGKALNRIRRGPRS
jgi:hypothetical protein